MSTGVAIAMAMVVVLAIGGVFLLFYLKSQPPQLTPGQQIGQGAGMLISGIIGAAS